MKKVTKPKRGQPKKDSVRKMVSIRMHPAITERLNSAVRKGSIDNKSRFIEIAVCDKLGMCHPDIE